DFVLEVDDRAVDERLEPAELEALDLHLKPILPCRRDRSGFVPNFIPAAYLAIVGSASCLCSAFPQLPKGGSRAVAIGRTSCHFTYGHCSVVTPERVDMQVVKIRSANFHVKTGTWTLDVGEEMSQLVGFSWMCSLNPFTNRVRPLDLRVA